MKQAIKKALKVAAHHTVLRPPYVKHCSQTIYQALLGCIRMWEATGDEKWKVRARKVVGILVDIQRPDGGFDIGYDFNFGKLHRVGESTSPELVGLVALVEYEHCFKEGLTTDAANRCANWILQHVVDLQDDIKAIPYGPYSTSEIMVYNGVSFAVGGLGRYLGLMESNDELQAAYKGMVKYLYNVMSIDQHLAGKFWYYSDQTRTDLSPLLKTKIDYYHQMQQVEMHALAQQVCPLEEQLLIIKEASDHIVAISEKYGVIPYTNDNRFFQGKVHVWGMGSIIPGLLEASKLLPERSEFYHQVARKTLDWLLAHSWNGNYFLPILELSGDPIWLNRYMVRSDAWVFNALASYQKYKGSGDWADVAELCYQKMESVNFSGLESHASNKVSRSMNKLMSKFV